MVVNPFFSTNLIVGSGLSTTQPKEPVAHMIIDGKQAGERRLMQCKRLGNTPFRRDACVVKSLDE